MTAVHNYINIQILCALQWNGKPTTAVMCGHTQSGRRKISVTTKNSQQICCWCCSY